MKQLDLLQALMGFVVSYKTLESGGSYPLPELKNVFTPAIRNDFSDLVPGAAAALAAYDAGADIDWSALGAGVKSYTAAYASSPGATASFVKALKAYVSYYSTGSETALKSIEKQSAAMSDPFLLNFFTPAAVDQQSVKKQLQQIVKREGGTGETLTKEQQVALKDRDAEAYKEYMLLRRKISEAWKAALSSFIRSKSLTTAHYPAVLAHLNSLGLEHTLPDGFTGLIDSTGAVYTKAGEAIAGGLPQRPLFTNVIMNDGYGPDSPWVFQAVRADGSKGNYFYTETFQRGQASEKFKKVQAFDAEATRKKWLPLVRRLNPHDLSANGPDELAAMILEMLYRTSNRIGTRHGGNENGGGFGICTLLVKHFYPQKDGKTVKLIYLGKDDVKTIVGMKPTDSPDPSIAARLCAMYYALASREGVKSKDPLIVTQLKNGTFKPIQPSTVNALFSKCAGVPGLTPHKLRTAKGTALFREFVDTLYLKRPKLNEKQVLEQMKAGATLVGKQLNHVRRSAEGTDTVSPMTSLQNYIDPTIVQELFDHYRVPYPAFLERFLVESSLEDHMVKGPDGKPLDWNNPTPEQRELFRDMTSEEYQQFCDGTMEDTAAGYDTQLLHLALREGVEAIL